MNIRSRSRYIDQIFKKSSFCSIPPKQFYLFRRSYMLTLNERPRRETVKRLSLFASRTIPNFAHRAQSTRRNKTSRLQLFAITHLRSFVEKLEHDSSRNTMVPLRLVTSEVQEMSILQRRTNTTSNHRFL